MRFSTLPVFTLLASWAYAIRAATVPGADTPLFYFVSTTQESTANLLVRDFRAKWLTYNV